MGLSISLRVGSLGLFLFSTIVDACTEIYPARKTRLARTRSYQASALALVLKCSLVIPRTRREASEMALDKAA